MRFVVLSCFLAMSTQLAAHANENACRYPLASSQSKGDKCSCSKELGKLPEDLKARLHFPGFKLVSACDVKRVPEEPEHFLGKFYLRGTRALSGKLRTEMSEAGALLLVLPGSHRPSSSYIEPQFRFANESAAWNELGLPQGPSGRDIPCREAQAELLVTELAVLRDYGTDYEGTYIVSFQPRSIGRFNACN